MQASVLVVEDEEVLRKGLAALLRLSRHTATEAATLSQAISHVDAITFTHLLLDLNLPDGTGADLLRRIRARALPIRVAVITGASGTPLLEEARDLGVDAVFIKPPDWDTVLDWVGEP